MLAHNTLLQWLTSLGIIGTLLMGFFYFSKYKLLFKGFKWTRFFEVFSIIMLASTGIIDQSITMDPFIFVIPYIYFAIIEEESKSKIVFYKNFLNKTQIKMN